MYSAQKKELDQKVEAKLPEPKGYKLLIALPEIEEKTEKGVYMPDELRGQESIASIIGFVVINAEDQSNINIIGNSFIINYTYINFT